MTDSKKSASKSNSWMRAAVSSADWSWMSNVQERKRSEEEEEEEMREGGKEMGGKETPSRFDPPKPPHTEHTATIAARPPLPPPLPPPPLEAENTIAHSRQWHLPDCRCADSSENKESETNPQHRSIPIEASRSERRTRRRRGAAGSRCCLSGLPDTARAGLDTPCIYVSVGHF